MPVLIFAFSCKQQHNAVNGPAINTKNQEWAIVIHGGAGIMNNLSEEQQREYRSALKTALDVGKEILKQGGSSLDAVEKTV